MTAEGPIQDFGVPYQPSRSRATSSSPSPRDGQTLHPATRAAPRVLLAPGALARSGAAPCVVQRVPTTRIGFARRVSTSTTTRAQRPHLLVLSRALHLSRTAHPARPTIHGAQVGLPRWWARRARQSRRACLCRPPLPRPQHQQLGLHKVLMPRTVRCGACLTARSCPSRAPQQGLLRWEGTVRVLMASGPSRHSSRWLKTTRRPVRRIAYPSLPSLAGSQRSGLISRPCGALLLPLLELKCQVTKRTALLPRRHIDMCLESLLIRFDQRLHPVEALTAQGRRITSLVLKRNWPTFVP